MSIIAASVSSKFFSFFKETNTMVTEISDCPKSFNHLSQVYDDACDAGFSIVSEKTGKVVTFYFEGIDYSGQGEDRETSGWRYEITPESVRKYPHLKGLKALVIND